MDITGPADGPPSCVSVAMTDYLAGQFLFLTILLSLRLREIGYSGMTSRALSPLSRACARSERRGN
jgi:crotonobetainyl-CoA:carnitine CoA-transferase CaiB-like acyl-CoA transferase